LNDDDFKLYKDSSGCSSLRCEEDLISIHQNQIDDIVDFETFNKLKEFSSKVQNLEEEINSKLIKLKNNITTNSTITTTSKSSTTTTTSNNSTSSTTTRSITTTTSSTTTTTNNKSKKIHEDIDKLKKKIVDLVENIMPPTFLQSLLIIPKGHLQLYKLHKVVLFEYNKYIDEVCESVNNISNNLSPSNNYSYVKNKERKSRNLFPSFKNKLNDILLKHADEFGFVKQKQPSPPVLSSHQEHKNKKLLKKVNKKKIRYMHNLLYKEYKEYKEKNPNDINLDLKEYPPVVINQIGEKNKNLKMVDSISMHYDLSNFKTIEGTYIN
jgi:hypothetical protein